MSISALINPFRKEVQNISVDGSFTQKTDILRHVSVGVVLSTYRRGFEFLNQSDYSTF